MPGPPLASVTLPRTRFLYLAAILLVVLPLIVGIVYFPVLTNAWCEQFEIPEYERSFGFRMATLEFPSSQGGTYSVHGIGSVELGGRFAAAGVRPGDVPRMQHGFASFCGALAAASDGYEATLDVVNLHDVRSGRHERRRITLRRAAS